MLLFISLGGGVGAACRAFILIFIVDRRGIAIRYTLLAINMIGSLIAGVVIAWWIESEHMGIVSVAVSGVLGGFTSFSSFAVECVEQWQRGFRFRSIMYACTSMIACTATAWGGFILVKEFLQ